MRTRTVIFLTPSWMKHSKNWLSLMVLFFIVRGNGVVETAGSLIQAKADNIILPGGLGTRHAAAAAITYATDSIALVVSISGQVTYFRKGRMFTLFEKSAGLGTLRLDKESFQDSPAPRLGFFGGTFDPPHNGHLADCGGCH